MFKRALLLILLSFTGLTQAESVGYETLDPAQPTQNQAKIEVIEFFWYGCPHCYSLEPLLNQWLATKPENVEFIRQPAAFNPTWAQHAKAYLTAEALGVAEKMHADFFDAIQTKKQKLVSEADLAAFFVKHGVAKADFESNYDSFFVATKLAKATAMAGKYGLSGVPALIVNGKYKISGSTAGSHEGMIKVLKQLIIQETPAATK